KNHTTNLTSNVAGAEMRAWEAPKLRENFDHRGHQCNACGMHHCHMSVIRHGDQKGKIVDEPEYEGWSGCGWAIGAADRDGVAWLNTECDKACVDVNEWGWLCGWVMECQEKGYITREQLGFELKWGDIKGAHRLLQMVSRREGLGNLLAEGVKRAAERLGGAAKECAVYIEKGATPRGHDHRARWEEMLDTCTSSTATMETGNPVHPTEIGQPARVNPFDGEQVAKYVAGLRGRRMGPRRGRPSGRSGRRCSTPGTPRSASTGRPASRGRRRSRASGSTGSPGISGARKPRPTRQRPAERPDRFLRIRSLAPRCA